MTKPLRESFLEIKRIAIHKANDEKVNAIIAKLSGANKIWSLLDVYRKDRTAFKTWKSCIDK